MSERVRRVMAGMLTIALAAVVAYGVAADEPTPEQRLAALGDRIACPVCDGSSIADSPSAYARDMMRVVEEQIAEGRSDDEILAFFESRYSPAIRLDTPASGERLALWGLPLVALAIGVFLAGTTRRRSRSR